MLPEFTLRRITLVFHFREILRGAIAPPENKKHRPVPDPALPVEVPEKVALGTRLIHPSNLPPNIDPRAYPPLRVSTPLICGYIRKVKDSGRMESHHEHAIRLLEPAGYTVEHYPNRYSTWRVTFRAFEGLGQSLRLALKRCLWAGKAVFNETANPEVTQARQTAILAMIHLETS